MADKRKYADRAEYIKLAVNKRRKKVKQMAIEYKGGQCQICGYKRYAGSLDLHHIVSSQKEFGISEKGLSRSWERVKAEADKCILVCANCHREIHAGVVQLSAARQTEKHRDNGETLHKSKGNTVGTSQIAGAP